MEKNFKTRLARGTSSQKKKRKNNSRKFIDRISSSQSAPTEHRKTKRQTLRNKPLSASSSHAPSSTLKFGSMNLNGLNLETSWAVEELILEHKFDVKNIIKNKIK